VSEPKAVAQEAWEVVSGLWHWNLDDERIGGFIGGSHAVATEEGTVLIDPHPLAEDALARLGAVAAIVLTASVHQRASWRLRREFGMPVWVPAATREAEEEPDERYSQGDRLPGGLEAIFTPGAGTTQHTLLDRQRRAAFVSDLLVRPRGGRLALLGDDLAHDAAQLRETVEMRLLALDVDILCLGHGKPVIDTPNTALRAALGA
jgi:glyoxylase-like metal-dependent hydrolase (beta-lactamase superfamily II)